MRLYLLTLDAVAFLFIAGTVEALLVSRTFTMTDLKRIDEVAINAPSVNTFLMAELIELCHARIAIIVEELPPIFIEVANCIRDDNS